MIFAKLAIIFLSGVLVGYGWLMPEHQAVFIFIVGITIGILIILEVGWKYP